MPFYPAPDSDVQPAAARAGVACRCCPGGISRSTRARRYPSDMTDAEWAVCDPLLPAPAWLAGRGGRPSRYCMRDIVDAIRYLIRNGLVWRALPADFPPAGTVYGLGGQMAGRRLDRSGCTISCATGSAQRPGGSRRRPRR